MFTQILKKHFPALAEQHFLPALRAPNSFFNPTRFKIWKQKPYNLGFLRLFRESDSIGPLQKDEALLLFGIVRTLRPAVILEFGFFWGHSGYNFIKACDHGARVFSFDIGDISERIANKYFRKYPNFRFIRKSQTEFISSDIEDLKADLVFIDAAHDLQVNIETFRRIKESLSTDAVILIHDTGTWLRQHLERIHLEIADSNPDDWIGENEFQHQRDEREFVNYLRREHPEFSQINFHTLKVVRHGITMLQRSDYLQTTP